MCIAFLAYRTSPEWPLIIAANRDEYHAREALAAMPWIDAPHILGGIDKVGGGTWLAVDRQARLGFLTNYRHPQELLTEAPTRGLLVSGFLQQERGAYSYLQQLMATATQFNGFNIVLGNAQILYYFNNQEQKIEALTPGYHVLSNQFMNSPWPKSERLRQNLAKLPLADLLNQQQLEPIFTPLYDKEKAPDAMLPRTGISLERERLLSSPFIVSDTYGTRCSTIMAVHQSGQVYFAERRFNAQAQLVETNPNRLYWPWA